MTIGEIIKTRRNELGLSVDEVAKRIGKDRSTVYRYESNDITKIPVTILEPLAKILNITPTALMGCTNNHSTKNTTNSDNLMPSSWYIHIPSSVSLKQVENHKDLQNFPRISIPDAMMGKYAKNPNIVFMHVEEESLNHVIAKGSAIAVMMGITRKTLQNGDIIIASTTKNGYIINRYYDFPEKRQIILAPDSSDPSFFPILIPYDTTNSLCIFGKVVLYFTTL